MHDRSSASVYLGALGVEGVILPERRLRARRSLSRPRPKGQIASLLAHGGPHIAIVISLALAVFPSLILLGIDGGRLEPETPLLARPVPLLIVADGKTYRLESRAATVGGALAEAGIIVGPHDAILQGDVKIEPAAPLQPPPPDLALASQIGRLERGRPAQASALLVLRLRRAVPITIREEGVTTALHSSAETVGEALEAAGIELGPFDWVLPIPTTPLSAGLHLYVDHALVRVEEVVEEDRLEHAVVYQDDSSLPAGTNQVLEPGSDGFLRRLYRLTYVNGELVSRELASEEYVPPSDEVVVRGTKLLPQQLLLSDGSVVTYVQTLRVYASWYNAASSGGDGVTATGLPLDVGICAVDPSVIPLGTSLYVPGYGYCLAADTGGGIFGYMIDLGYPGSTIGSCCIGWLSIYILA